MASPCAYFSQLSQRAAVRATLLVVGGLAPWFAGCRAVDNAQVDVLERELRQQEDYIYELEDAVMTYSEKLRECRSCQPAASPSSQSRRPTTGEPTLADDRRRSSAPPRRAANGSARLAPPAEAPAVDEPAVEQPATPAGEAAPEAAPATQPIDPESLEVPELELGPTGGLQLQDAAPIATRPAGPVRDEAPPYIPDPANYQIDVDASAPIAAEQNPPDEGLPLTAIADQQSEESPPLDLPLSEPILPEAAAAEPMLPPETDASRLIAQRLQIRSIYAEPGNVDTGKAPSLLAVVEALNATDEPVDADGEISLMVTVGESQDNIERIDRWDFSAEESQAAWQSSPLGDGLHLALPLNKTALPTGPLTLFARLVKPDGTKLLATVSFQADRLTSLDEALAAPAAEDALSPAAEPGEQLAESAAATPAQAIEAAPKPNPVTQWRASSEPLAVGRVEGLASTMDGAGGGWMRQAPGRMPTPSAPRVADASNAKPRWQQGSATPSDKDDDGSWTPFR